MIWNLARIKFVFGLKRTHLDKICSAVIKKWVRGVDLIERNTHWTCFVFWAELVLGTSSL